MCIVFAHDGVPAHHLLLHVPPVASVSRNDSPHAPAHVNHTHTQPQGHVQTFLNMVEFGLDSQEALDAPRFCLPHGTADGLVCLEAGIDEAVVEELRRRGHNVC